jgi:processive rubber oxygenase RoxA-like protein/cbb3-type cytochrome c oxidase subunit III
MRLVGTAAALLAALMCTWTAAGQTSSDIVAEFKYGSVGTEETVGVPYWLWRVLPEVFADKLPTRPGNGYARLGFTYETPTSDLPMGASKSTDWIPRVGLNCATCHVGAYRDAPGAPPTIVLGMPAHQMDLQGYARFLSAVAKDPRFNADTLVAAMKKHPEFGFFDGLVYKWLVIRRTRDGILERDSRIAWFDKRPPQGPGRVDTFNPYKAMFAEETHFDTDDTVGTADLPSLWNQRIRDGLWLHWDGNNNSVAERNKSAAIGAGATPDSLDLEALDRIAEWILDLEPPPFPPGRIDAALATAGTPIYRQHCASCHDVGQPRVGQVIDLADIGTDPERLRSFTPELATQMNTIGTGKPWRFSHFRKTGGYAGMPLDGAWLRAPYLHNGSVPTLRALLFLDERPARFYRAYDVYDWRAVGFVSSGPDAERHGVAFDTSHRGNGNGGHTYGRDLSIQDREALIEYLKTL